MKKLLLLLVAAALFAACSSPKYAYHFDTHNYNVGKKKITNAYVTSELTKVEIEAHRATLTAETPLTASTETVVAETKANTVLEKVKVLTHKYSLADLDSKSVRKELKSDIKELKKELKKEIKENKKKPASINKTERMDNDLKMAAIFGSVGLVLTFLGGVNSVFWILGVIAIVIGVVFFIKWLARQ